jgi:hypothetical protein
MFSANTVAGTEIAMPPCDRHGGILIPRKINDPN